MNRHLAALLSALVCLSSAAQEPTHGGLGVADWARRLAEERDGLRDLKAGGDAALPLIRALLRGDRAVGQAARALEPLGAAALPALPELIAAVAAGPTDFDRLHAALAIGRLGHVAAAAAVPTLLGALADAGFYVRGAAAQALGQLGARDPAVIRALTALTRDETPYVRERAGAALARLRPDAADGDLLRTLAAALLDEDATVRRAAAKAYWTRGERALEYLRGRLRRADGLAFIPALAEGDEAALSLLLEIVDDASRPPAAVSAARDALVAMGWLAIPALEDRDEAELIGRVFTHGSRALLKLGETWHVTRGDRADVELAGLDVQWESGSGHGGTLALHRLVRDPGGLLVERMRFTRSRATPGATIAVDHARLAPRRARAALTALLYLPDLRVEERAAPGQGGGWSSSADFHAAIRVVAGERTLLAERYTGYPGSHSIPRYARARIAGEVLRAATASLEFEARQASERDALVLSERLADFEDTGWWVQERLLRLVEEYGDARHVAPLKAIIAGPIGSVSRRHRHAIDAYARITGHDLRPRDFGDDASVAAVRERYREAWSR